MTEDGARRKATSELLMHYCNEITRLMVDIGQEVKELRRLTEEGYRISSGDNPTTTKQEERC